MTHVLLFEIGSHCSDEMTFFVSLDRDIYARVMYGGLYSDEFVMPMSEAESRGLARRHYTSETYARGIFRRCRRALRRSHNDLGVTDEHCNM